MSNDLMVYLKTTDTCQLNCNHCFTNGSNGKKGFFDPKATIKFFERLKDHRPNYDNATISFHGGEPFLCPTDHIFSLYEGVQGLWDNIFWTTQTNLTYKLTDDKLKVMEDICQKSWGTSWDFNIRWTNSKQEELWRNNVKDLANMGHNITVMVALTGNVIREKEPIDIINDMASLGVKHLNFERVTANGNAVNFKEDGIFPSNIDLDCWLHKMWLQSVENRTWEYIDNMFFDPLLSSLTQATHGGTHCRNCEQKIFTINAAGTIGGCPNGATNNTYGTIFDDIPSIMNSPGRSCNIVKEINRNPLCYTCPVYDVCNGDCHQLSWQGDICAAPKSLMKELKSQVQSQFNFYKHILEESV